MSGEETIRAPGRRRLLLLAPLAVTAVAGAAFYEMLQGMKSGTFDPRGLPSPLVGRKVPDFALPAQPPATDGFASTDLAGLPQPVLVNFFASWCEPCIEEAPALMALARQGVPIWGIAYKDRANAAADFLQSRGNPYVRMARDEPGRVAIDWGVYGVPETYLIDRQGVVRWRWAGPLTPAVMKDQLVPTLKALA